MSIESIAEVSAEKVADITVEYGPAEPTAPNRLDGSEFSQHLGQSPSAETALPADGELSVQGIESLELGNVSQAAAAPEATKTVDMLELPMFKRVSEVHNQTIEIYNKMSENGALSPEELLGYQIQLQELSFEMKAHMKAVGLLTTGIKEILRQQG